MTGPVIGGVAVEVAPDARGWVPKFRAQVLPGASKVGDEYGHLFGDEASRQAVQAFERGMAKTNPRLDGTRQGDAFGTAFRTQLAKALDNLPKAKLDADATEAERKLDRLRAQLTTLDKTVGVHVSDQAALNALNFLRVELDTLTTGDHDIRVRVDAQAAAADLAALQARIASVSQPAAQGAGQGDAFGAAFTTQVRKALENLPPAKLDADASAAEKKLDQLRAELSNLDTRFGVDISDQASLRELHRLRAELDTLTVPEHDIRVRINASAASAELAALQAKIAAVTSQSGAPVGEDLLSASPMVLALVAALPLVAPAAGAATGAVVTFAGAAGVAVLAVKGLNNEIKQDTALGRDLQAQLGGIGGALTHLEASAARGASTGVLSGLKQIDDFLPTLNPEVEQLARHLGNAFSIGTGGLIAGLQVAEPLLSDAGGFAEAFARKLADAAASPEFAAFIAYARKELPIVGGDLADVAKLAVDLGVALQPIGDEFLKEIDGIVRGVDKLTGSLTLVTRATDSGILGKGFHLLTVATSPVSRLTDMLGQLGGKSKQSAQQQDEQTQATIRQEEEAQRAAASIQAAAGAFGISEQSAKAYAAVLGVTAEQVSKGKISQDALNEAVGQVASAYNQASQTGTQYLSSLSQFAQSEGTAADRAALIGATLRAANGDALAFGGAMAEAAQADTALTTAFADQAAQAASNAEAVQSAQAALSIAHEQAARSLQNALDGVASSERAVTAAQQAALNAQKALTAARVAAKQAAEDLANQVIDGQLSERQAVLSLQSARAALGKPGGNQAQQQLAYDEAVQQLKEIRLQNQRLAADKAASDRAGINGSNQVVSAQQNVASATQAISDAQRNLAKSQQAVIDAQDQGAHAIANAQRAVATAAANQAKALRASELAAIDAKTGLIDYAKQGAGPLVQQLQAIQDAAQKAAEATYQHELAQKGGTTAAQDAAKVYDDLTRGALTRQATQLGITKDTAKKLADQYFAMPDDVKTTIAMIGGDPTLQTLDEIGQLLANLTHQTWVSHFGVAGLDGALAKVIAVQKRLANLADSIIYVQVNERTATGQFSSGRQVFDAEGSVLDFYANGGLNNGLAKLQHFAMGTEQHIAQIAPAGSLRVWAEAETGGEAYIPLAPSKRVRSELILAEVARRFGDTLVKGQSRAVSGNLAGAELRTDRSRQGNVTVEQTIMNPLPEPASVSGPKGLRRAAYELGN